MASIIEELYYGNIQPLDKTIDKKSVSYKALEKFNNLADDFTKNLSKEEREKFENIIEIHTIYSSLTEKDAFVDGFKLGSQLMMELVYDSKET